VIDVIRCGTDELPLIVRYVPVVACLTMRRKTTKIHLNYLHLQIGSRAVAEAARQAIAIDG
ncbi:MAG: hypothetical protein ORN83_06735, partial [Chthoniobacteraceae bacterium]|nr:hypothetical protein [Chthoniobacteraceae bacterium]